MPRNVRRFQTDFSGGEFDPRAHARVDTVMYKKGAASLRNSQPQITGGTGRRWGTLYLDEIGADAIIREFMFNDGQRYVLAFYNTAVKFYNTSGTLLQTSTSQPWLTADLTELRMAFAGDTIYVVHPDFEPRKILRTGASTFTISTYSYENDKGARPYFEHHDAGVTLTLSATSGTITITASAAAFDANMAGGTLKVKDDTTWRYITGLTYTSSTVMGGTCDTTFSSVANPFTTWSEWAYSASKGWPAVVAFHGSRLWMGGGDNLPTSLFATKTSAYSNFDVGTALDTEGIAVSLTNGGIQALKHLFSARHLMIFSDQGFGYVAESDTRTITPGSFNYRAQARIGIADARPLAIEQSVIFVQDQGRVIREAVFADYEQVYSSNPLSHLSSHLITGVRDSGAVQGIKAHPDQYGFFVTDAGKCVCMHMSKSEKLISWRPWDTDGEFRSVCVVRDEVFFVVKRTINSTTKYYLEKLSEDVTLDCAVQKTGSALTTWTGLSHLAAKTVKAVNNNMYYGEATVSGGSITLTEAADAMTIGLDYTHTITDLPVSDDLPNGPSAGNLKRVARVQLQLDDSYAITVQGRRLLLRRDGDDFSTAPDDATGFYEFFLRGWDRTGQITIEQEEPLKLTVLGIVKEVLE